MDGGGWGGGKVLGIEAEELSLTIIKFQTISRHPSSDVGDACLEIGQSMIVGVRGGWSIISKIQLGIICIQMIPSAMRTENVTNRQGINCEQDGA